MARSALGRTGGRNRSGRHQSPWGWMGVLGRPESNRFWLIVGFLVRRRAELTAIAVTWWVFLYVEHRLPPDLPGGLSPAQGAGILIGVTALVIVAVPYSRRLLWRRCWAVLTRHRMRACFYQTRTWTVSGRMPFLLWSRPSPVGERVRVWLPAGLSANHLDRITDELAAACWAREARITPVPNPAALIVVDTVRHDPLGSRLPLTPPVVDHLDVPDGSGDELARRRNARTPTWPPRPEERDTPTVVPAGATCTETSKTTGTTSIAGKAAGAGPGAGPGARRNGSAETPVTGFGGEDVSDYI